jgi:acetyltransferase-like isoleucine patch superfamily enzyme
MRIIRRIIYRFFRLCIDIAISEEYDMLSSILSSERRRRADKIIKKIRLIGENVTINGIIHISDPDYVVIGNNVHIGNNAYFKTSGGLIIGDNTHISRNVTIYTQSHDYEGERIPYDDKLILDSVVIGKNVWIGMNVTIAPGVKVGDGAIIAIGAVIASDVPSCSIVGMQKYRFLKSRNIDHYNLLTEKKQFGGISGRKLSSKFLAKLNGREKGKKLFFVVSTGRAGSASIANILSQHPQIKCFHEANRQLIRLSTEFCHKKISEQEIKDHLMAIYCSAGVYPKDFIVGDSNLKVGNLIKIIAEILPDAKFIWLIRDGRDFVASAYNRDWFNDEKQKIALRHQWDIYRINGYQAGVFSEEEWKRMSPFERCCWYWSYWNNEIYSQLSKIETSRFINIKIENISRDILTVQDFLKVNSENLIITRDNAGEKTINHHWKDWTEQQKTIFYRHCADLFNKYYC